MSIANVCGSSLLLEPGDVIVNRTISSWVANTLYLRSYTWEPTLGRKGILIGSSREDRLVMISWHWRKLTFSLWCMWLSLWSIWLRYCLHVNSSFCHFCMWRSLTFRIMFPAKKASSTKCTQKCKTHEYFCPGKFAIGSGSKILCWIYLFQSNDLSNLMDPQNRCDTVYYSHSHLYCTLCDSYCAVSNGIDLKCFWYLILEKRIVKRLIDLAKVKLRRDLFENVLFLLF